MTFDFSEFKNKKIIVTGSSTGIGFETGVEFLNLGANVIFHGFLDSLRVSILFSEEIIQVEFLRL